MVEMNLTDEKDKAVYFKNYETYVFVQTHTNLYNGRILQVEDGVFIFMDDKIPAPFPIPFTTLKAPIVPSKKKGNDFNYGREIKREDSK